MRPHLDYGDIIYDEAYNETFRQKLESSQYNACLALSGAIRGSPRENFYQELDLESHLDLGTGNVAYFINFSKKINQFTFSIQYQQKVPVIIPEIQMKLLYFTLNITFSKKNFPSTAIKWNKLHPNLRTALTLSVFKKNFLKLMRPSPNNFLMVTTAKETNTPQDTPWFKSFA